MIDPFPDILADNMMDIREISLLVAVNTTGSTQTIKTPIVIAGSAMIDVINNREVIVPVTLQLEPYGYNIIMN